MPRELPANNFFCKTLVCTFHHKSNLIDDPQVKILNLTMMKISNYSSLGYFLILIFTCLHPKAQSVYYHNSNTAIVNYIDELANAGIIKVSTVVKPYTRQTIAALLDTAYLHQNELNKRQIEELRFFLRDFQKELSDDKGIKKRLDLFHYRNAIFNITINPILGFKYFANDSSNFYHRWNGAEFFATAGKIGMYASLRDNRQNKILSTANYLNQFEGADYKVDGKGGGDYSEMRGGITYGWKWGTVGLLKDHFTWGDNQHGANIFSGRAPSFAHLKLQLQPAPWLDFNYVHAWLNSEVIDSAASYPINGANRLTFRKKYMAANLFTVRPIKKLNISFGNSIVYGDIPIQAAYLIPFMFFKSIDHSLTGAGSNYLGQNSQLFFNISSRNIKNIHLYTSLFVDEISLSNMWDSEKQSNFISFKIGAHISNLGIQNIQLTAEYTRTNPLTYRHYLTTATFASNNYSLGHYLGDNSQELYAAIQFKPIKNFSVRASLTMADKGISYYYDGRSGTIGSGKGKEFLTGIYWTQQSMSFEAQYQIINDVYCNLGFLLTNQSAIDANAQNYSPSFMRGKLGTLNFGLNVGF